MKRHGEWLGFRSVGIACIKAAGLAFVLVLMLSGMPQAAPKKTKRRAARKSKSKAKGPEVPAPEPGLPPLDIHCVEDEALAVLADGAGWSDSYCGETIQRVIERGWWKVSEHLVSECRARNYRVASPVYKAKSTVSKALNTITNLLSGPSAVISPAFQWSQNKEYILLNIKFAHKLDTPATLGVKSTGVNITEKRLVFTASSKTKNKRFRLDLTLARAVVPDGSEWSMNAVGRATIQLRKKHPDTAWIKLLHPKERVPQNMHTWWAMKEQHENELKTLDTSMTDAKAIKIEENRKKAAQANSTENSGDNATSGSSGAGDGKSGTGEDPQPSEQEILAVEETIDPAVAEDQRQRKELEKQKRRLRKAILDKAKGATEEIDNKARREKKQVDDFGRDKKAKVDAEAATEKSKVQQEKAVELTKLEKEYEEKFAKLGSVGQVEL